MRICLKLVHLFLPGVCASFPHTTSISWTLGKEMNLECPLPNLHSQGGVESNGFAKEPPCSGRLCVEQKDINMKPLQLRRNPLNGSLKKKTNLLARACQAQVPYQWRPPRIARPRPENPTEMVQRWWI